MSRIISRARDVFNDDPLNRVLSRLDGVTDREGGYTALCPAHKDNSPSLSIGTRDDGAVLLHCFTGCTAHEICRSIGLTLADLFPSRRVRRGWVR
jgi:DNA primase